MDTGIFIALINPGIALTFAATFLVLWNYQRQKTYIIILSASFVALSAGFVLQYFAIFSLAHSRFFSNLLFLAGGVGIAASVLGRYNRSVPVLPMVTTGLLGLAAFAWFLYFSSSIVFRIYAINFTFGALTLQVAAQLRSVENRKPIDMVLIGLTFFWGLSFFIRPIVVMWIEAPSIADDQYHQSLYWYTLTLSCAMFILLLSLTTICALVLDIVEDLKRLSDTDPLSGLLNRRGFEEKASAQLKLAMQQQVRVSLIVCDLDHFKKINDTFGHAAGDDVIRVFAHHLATVGSDDHIIGRSGGEEFAVLLTGADLKSARSFAEDVRRTFGSLMTTSLPHGGSPSASFGVAEWVYGETIDQLLVRADEALYDAKNSGRDCVRAVASPDTRLRALVTAAST